MPSGDEQKIREEEVERLEHILANVMNFTKPGDPILRDRDINEFVESVCAFHEHDLAERHGDVGEFGRTGDEIEGHHGRQHQRVGHAVWHVFVLAGSVLHYLAVLFAVGMAS
mgnify:CR=1 FL=1